MRDNLENLLAEIAKLRILVIGDIMLDHYIWGDATRISPEAPVPVVKIERDTFTAGGAANVALNLRSLDAEVVLAGAAGQDDDGRRLTDVLARSGIELTQELLAEGRSTIVKTRVMCRSQQLCRLDREADPSAYVLSEEWMNKTLPGLIAASDAVIISDYAKGVVTSELIARIQGLAAKKCLVSLDPKPRPELNFTGLNVMTPNRNEALLLAQLHGASSADPFPVDEVCRRLHDTFATDLLVITLGAEGMLISREGRLERHVPTAAQAVFDVSGAGDTVNAVLTAALATGAPAEQAVELANLAAGVVVAKLGTASATAQEIIEHDRICR